MPAVSTPLQETERLRALHDYDVLDTPPEPAFDELAALAARICGTPISLVTFIDRDRQWFKARHGVDLAETPRDVSFCAHAVARPDELLIVPDATLDPRFAANPFVTGDPGVRFYAGVPLCTLAGQALGTLCVIDRQPRTLSPNQLEALRVLGRQVVAQLELRRSRHEMDLNEVRLENSQRIAHLGDWEYDFAQHRLLWSDEIYRILGLSRRECPPDAETFYRQVHPDDLALVHREKKAAADGVRRADFEHRIIRPGGEVRYLHQITELTRDGQGRPDRESGTLQDITARKLAESTLRVSEARFRALSESAPIGIFECDGAGRAIYYNPALTTLSGRPAAASLGQGWEQSIHPDDRLTMRTGWERAVASGSPWDQEQRLLRPDGTLRWVHTLAAPSWDATGGITGFVGTVEDITARKRTDEQLREKTAYLEAKLDSSLDGILIVDSQGRKVIQNRLFRELLHVPDSLAEGSDDQPMLQFVADLMRHPDAFLGKVRHLYNHPDETSRDEIELIDGTVLDRYSSPVRDKHGKDLGRIWTFRDITARKRAETLLQASEIRYRRLFEAAQDGVLILNETTGMVEDVNPFLTNLLGFTKEQFLGKKVWELGCFQNLIANQEKFMELQRNEYIRYEDLPLETAAGRQIDVEFVSNVYEEDGAKVLQCNIRDITARKAAERALRESEERFKFVARAVSDVVWDWDLLTGHLWWSDGFMTTFGYAASDIQPGLVSWTSRIHPDELRLVVEGIHQAIDRGAKSWAADYRFRCKDGRYAFVQDSGYILRDAAGKGVRMVGGMRDLTEQKKMEAQSLRAQRMESIGTLAGGIAHDLNNVLSPIMMSIELLRLDSGEGARRTKILDTIQVSCRRGADLVRHVLSFARGVDGVRIAIRLRQVINELEGIIGETFPRNIRIVPLVPEDIWPIMGDPTQLHQILLNLAVNARDAMPEGGTLTLAANNVTLDAQYAGTSPASPAVKAGPYVRLQVTETGHGIPPEVRERIFEPFFTTKELGKGTGLGLATVHAVVKDHGGFVTVQSEVGAGSTFDVYLPADPALRTAAPAPLLSTALPRGRGELVLVVDDEPSIREITQQTLEAFGYRVVTAGDGASAIALYAKDAGKIALVITDLMMPIMDGAATIKVLMRMNPSIRIIAASGLEVAENVAGATSAGVRDFLPKPYSAPTLIQLVRKVLYRPVTPANG